MHFAYPLPWWLAVLLAAAIAAAAFLEYRRPLAPLTRLQRGVLASLRVAVLAALVLFLFRPIAILPPSGSRDAIVPVLVDVSRSMRVADADGQARLARAIALLKTDLLPALSPRFVTELYAAGDGLAPTPIAQVDRLAADARRTDLAGALRRCASATAVNASRASSCCRTAGRIGWGRRGGKGRNGRNGRRAAGVCRRHRIARWSARSRGARHHGRRSAARSVVGGSARDRGQQRLRSHAVRAARARQRSGARHAAHRAARRWLADRRGVHRVARFGEPDRLHRRDSEGRSGDGRREQRPQRAREPAGPEAARAHRRRGARLRAQLHDARVVGRRRARRRFGHPQREERRRSGHVLRPGRSRPFDGADDRLPAEARAAVRLRRAWSSRTSKAISSRARSWACRPISSPNAAAACSCSAAGRLRSAASRARRSRKCCPWS